MRKMVTISLIALLLAACGTFELSAEPVAPEDATATVDAREKPDPAAEATEEPAAQPTEAPATPDPGAVLPAPLYYMNPADGQIWRMEMDGQTIQQVTAEMDPIDGYDINPVDGSVLVLTNNDIVLMDALGQNRRVLVDGPTQDEIGVHWYALGRVSRPVWAPDGTSFAYGMNGVNVYDLATSTSSVLLPNDELPAEGEPWQRPIFIYDPHSYAPAMSRMLVLTGLYQSEGGIPQVLELDGSGTLTELQGAGFPCCTFVWGQDSQTIYSANDTLGMLQPGLWMSNAATGETVTIEPPNPEGDDGDIRVFNWPHDLGNGEIYTFWGEGPRTAYESGQPNLKTLGRVDVSTQAFVGGLDDYWIPGEAVWLPDGSGVVITNQQGVENPQPSWPPVGMLVYLKTNGGQPVHLNVEGHTVHWGL